MDISTGGGLYAGGLISGEIRYTFDSAKHASNSPSIISCQFNIRVYLYVPCKWASPHSARLYMKTCGPLAEIICCLLHSSLQCNFCVSQVLLFEYFFALEAIKTIHAS